MNPTPARRSRFLPLLAPLVPRAKSLHGALGLFLLALALSPVRAGADLVPSLEGLWSGWIVYAEGQIELDFVLEMAPGADGKLVGTIDLPSQEMKFYPLTTIELDGSDVVIDFFRDSERTKNARYLFEGELSADGTRIQGMFTGWYDDDGRNHVPFSLERTGEAFEERPEVVAPPLVVLSGAGDDLRRAFDRDADKVRLVVLLSPKCGICLASARMIQRYVLDAVDAEGLVVHVLWGPMLGNEEEEHARSATVFLPDARVQHFWTPRNDLAASFSVPLGLGEELAWDTFLLYPPGPTWGPEAPPVPSSFMHIGRSLPADRRFNGKVLAEDLRALLATPPVAVPPEAEASAEAGGATGR